MAIYPDVESLIVYGCWIAVLERHGGFAAERTSDVQPQQRGACGTQHWCPTCHHYCSDIDVAEDGVYDDLHAAQSTYY